MNETLVDPYVPYMWYSYFFGVACLMLATWWLFRKFPELAQFCTVTVAAWLLTPVALAPPDYPQLAPAFFVFVLDGIFTDQSVARAGWALAIVWVAALLVSLLVRLAWLRWRKSCNQVVDEASQSAGD